MNNITNFSMTFKQNFLTREACFSWDKMTDIYNDIYYDIFVNDNFLFRIQENKICLNLGVGCEEKCVKARPVFKNKSTGNILLGYFTDSICYYTPADRYCNLKKNKLQIQKIEPKDRAQYIRKLNLLQKPNVSRKRIYASAVKNQVIASSFTWCEN